MGLAGLLPYLYGEHACCLLLLRSSPLDWGLYPASNHSSTMWPPAGRNIGIPLFLTRDQINIKLFLPTFILHQLIAQDPCAIFLKQNNSQEVKCSYMHYFEAQEEVFWDGFHQQDSLFLQQTHVFLMWKQLTFFWSSSLLYPNSFRNFILESFSKVT